MVAMTIKFRLLGEYGDSNMDAVLEGKLENQEQPERQSKKRPEKEQCNSTILNHS